LKYLINNHIIKALKFGNSRMALVVSWNQSKFKLGLKTVKSNLAFQLFRFSLQFAFQFAMLATTSL